MTGMFELFTGSDASYRFRLTAPDGTVMALSKRFPDKPSAVAGIAAVREYAGMGLVSEISVAEDNAVVDQSGPFQVFPGAGVLNRVAHEARTGDGGRLIPRSGMNPRTLGERGFIVDRNHNPSLPGC